MALFKNVFKKENEAPKKTAKKFAEAPAFQDSTKKMEPQTIRFEAGIGILVSPHLTEKSVADGAKGTYTFRIGTHANKAMVKKAVEDRFGVRVTSVRITSVKSKKRRMGRRMGTVPGFRKAMVRLFGEQRIELGV